MNKQLGKLLAAVLLLACLPVRVLGTESSQETVSKETGLSEGALIDVSIWQADEWTPLQAGESWQLTNSSGETLVWTAEGQSGNMPWRPIVYPGSSGGNAGVEHSDYYLLELDLQWIEGKQVNVGILKYANGGSWCHVSGRYITSVEFTPEALIITGQDMNYEATLHQSNTTAGGMQDVDIRIEGSGESRVCFTQLQEETVQVDTQLAPAALRLRDNDGQVDLTAQLAPEEIALVNQAITAPGITTTLPPEPESWPLALGIGAGVLFIVGIVLLLWRARRKKRPAPPESAPERPPEETGTQ